MAQVPIDEHNSQPWLVHQLAHDYEVEDVWRMPVELEPEDSLSDFWDQMQLAVSRLNKASPVALLFGVRILLGKIFRWDDSPRSPRALEMRRRYSELSGEAEELEAVGEFFLVYRRQDEYLAELENSTVQAALHLGRVNTGDRGTINLAVYSKPKGRLGRLYMAAIKPFRLWIVYPAILSAAGRQWEAYKAASSS